MKKQNGFIATSLLYTFFLAFIGLFMGMIAIYLQNRVYLIKLEDSSKNAIYIKEINTQNTIYAKFSTSDTNTTELTKESDGIYKNGSTKYTLSRCELIYKDGTTYFLEGCPTS